LFIQHAPNDRILGIFLPGLVVITRPGDAQQVTLTTDAEMGMVGVYQGLSVTSPNCADLRAKKSRSTVNCPI
jgi:hypothetical protein